MLNEITQAQYEEFARKLLGKGEELTEAEYRREIVTVAREIGWLADAPKGDLGLLPPREIKRLAAEVRKGLLEIEQVDPT